MKDSSRDKTVRIQVVVSDNELKAIDDYRFQFRLPNRAAAVRALLETGKASINDADDEAAN